MRTRLYSPSENVYPETLVVAPYPLGGVPANSDNRLRETAIRAHVSILGVQAIGTGNRAIFDMCRGATSSKRFAESCKQDIGGIKRAIKSYALDYDHLIGWGDSGRGINVMRMQEDTGIFSRILIRDGINLGFGLSKREQILRFLQYNEDDLPRPTSDLPPPSSVGLLGKLVTRVQTVAELHNYTNRLTSAESYGLAVFLAADRALPMRVVGVTHSFSGSRHSAEALAKSLPAIRELAVVQPGAYSSVQANVIEGGHSELLRPGLAAQHIGETMAIETIMVGEG